MPKTIRISNQAAKDLDLLSKELSVSKENILEKALKSFSRELFIKKTNTEYEKLRNDTAAWEQFQKS